MTLPRTPSFRLAGRRALVTGAGRGIGRAAAAALAEAGAEVVAVSRTRDGLGSLVGEIRRRGGRGEALVLDVADVNAARARSRLPDRSRSWSMTRASPAMRRSPTSPSRTTTW